MRLAIFPANPACETWKLNLGPIRDNPVCPGHRIRAELGLIVRIDIVSGFEVASGAIRLNAGRAVTIALSKWMEMVEVDDGGRERVQVAAALLTRCVLVPETAALFPSVARVPVAHFSVRAFGGRVPGGAVTRQRCRCSTSCLDCCVSRVALLLGREFA